MNQTLQLRMCVTPHRITIEATGPLTALTAHLLPKAVVGVLRRYPAPVIEIDLTGVTALDFVGDIALQDCACETTRRGILLIVTKPPSGGRQAAKTDHHNVSSRQHEPRTRTLIDVGAICRYHVNTR